MSTGAHTQTHVHTHVHLHTARLHPQAQGGGPSLSPSIAPFLTRQGSGCSPAQCPPSHAQRHEAPSPLRPGGPPPVQGRCALSPHGPPRPTQADPEPGSAASVKNQEADGWVSGPKVSVTTVQLRGSRARAAVGNSRQMTTGRGAHSVPRGALGEQRVSRGWGTLGPDAARSTCLLMGPAHRLPTGPRRGGRQRGSELCGQQLGTWRGAWSLFASCRGWARGARPRPHLLGDVHWPSSRPARICASTCRGGAWGRASGYELLFPGPGAGPSGWGGARDGEALGMDFLWGRTCSISWP